MNYFTIDSPPNSLQAVIHDTGNQESPIVLIVHGYFSSNRIGYNRFYFEVSKFLTSNFISSVRFDLSGMGESEGKLDDVKFNNHVLDVYNMVQYISKQYERKIVLFGHSMGCLIVLELINSHFLKPSTITKLVMVSPIFFDDSIRRKFFTFQMIEELERFGKTERKGVKAHKSFFGVEQSLKSVTRKINECNVPISLFFGDSDYYFRIEKINELTDLVDVETKVIPYGNHNFTESIPRKKLLEEILNFIISDE